MTTTAEKSTALVHGRPEAKDTSELFSIAKALSESEMCPTQFKKKPREAFAAIIAGSEVGFPAMQSLKTIAVINGRPSIFGDGLPAIAYGSGKMLSFSERFEGTPYDDDFCHVIEIERRDVVGKREFRFSVDDAKRANLWAKNGPWTQYPKRMIQMRNRAYAFRDCFADYLSGLHVAEEAMDIPEPEQPTISFSEPGDGDDQPGTVEEIDIQEPEFIDAEIEPVVDFTPPAEVEETTKPANGGLFGDEPDYYAIIDSRINNATEKDLGHLEDDINAAIADGGLDKIQYEKLMAKLRGRANEL